MLCEKCGSETLARGVKKTKCEICDMETWANIWFHDVCESCSNQYHICMKCGKEIKHKE